MKNVLFISSDKPEPLQLLLADPEVRLCAVTKQKYVGLYEGAAEVHPVDDVADLSQTRRVALDIARRHPIDAIIGGIERSQVTAAFLRSYLGLRGMKFDMALGFTHKVLMKQRARSAGLPTTAFEDLARFEDVPRCGERLGWPLLVKPAIGSGSMHSVRIDSPSHFAALLRGSSFAGLVEAAVPMIAERFVAIEAEYHCDGWISQGEVVFASVGRVSDCSPTPAPCSVLGTVGGFGGSYLLLESDPVSECVRDLHLRAVRALGMSDGVTHMEVLYAGGRFLLGEIASRPSGGGVVEATRRQYGVDLWRSYIDAHLERPPVFQRVTTSGLRGWYGLPCRNGRVRAITPSKELRAIPGITDVQLFYQSGDHVREKVSSVLYSGIVYFHVPNETALYDMNRALRAAFYIHLDDPSSNPDRGVRPPGPASA